MSKKRRSKSATNTNDMSNFNHEEDFGVTATEETAVESAIEAIEAIENSVATAESSVEAPVVKVVDHTIVPLDVLLVVFTKRIINSIDRTLWESAVNAVRQGRLVVLRGSAPHIEITAETFNSDAELPSGVSAPTSVLNNLLVGMV